MTDPKNTPDTDIDDAAEVWRFVDAVPVDAGPGLLRWTEPTPPALSVAVTHDGHISVQINGLPADEAARLFLDAVLAEAAHRNADLTPTSHAQTMAAALAFYADPKTYQEDGHFAYERRPIFDDRGERARAALNQTGGGNG